MKNIKFFSLKTKLKALFGLLLLLPAGILLAQADTARFESLTLKDLLKVKVTTASKTIQEIRVAPATVILVSKEQIRIRGYHSLLDLLYDLPDIKIDDKIYSGMRNSVTVRGIQGSEKFVVMLNGISISSPSGEALPVMENYPVNLAEQVEIVYGPASALYGANAVSAIINIISKTLPSHKSLAVEAATTYGSQGYTNTSLFVTKRMTENVSLSLSGQYTYDKGVNLPRYYNDSMLDVSGYRNGTLNTIYGPVTPRTPFRPTYEAPMTAYNIYAALQAYDFSFSFFRNYTKTPSSWGSNTSNSLYNKDAFMAQHVTAATASYKKAFGDFNSSTSLNASQYSLDPKSNYRNLYTAMEPAYKYSNVSMIKAEQQLDYTVSSKLNLSAGIGFENYHALPQSTDLQAPVNTDEFVRGTYLGTEAFYRPTGIEAQFYFIRYYNVQSYLQAQYSPNDKINITAGARFDINSRYGNSLNPRLALVYKPDPRTTLKVLYGSAFLAPNPSTTYAQYGSFETADSGRTYHSYFLHLPNPGLKPIRSYNTEFSLQRYMSDNLSVSMNVYYTLLKGLYSFSNDNETAKIYNNMFNGIPVDYIEIFTNNNRQKTYGGSMQVNWKHTLGKAMFNTYASLSYVNGVKEEGLKESNEVTPDVQLDFISPLIFHIGSDIKYGRFSFAPRLIAMGRQRLPGIADTTGHIVKRQTIPGYLLLNASLRFDVSKRISVYANISNALNQRYRAVGFNMDLNVRNTDLFYGQPEDRTRVMAGINFNF
jgi:outer membrane receptor protein involved in Fe transport